MRKESVARKFSVVCVFTSLGTLAGYQSLKNKYKKKGKCPSFFFLFLFFRPWHPRYVYAYLFQETKSSGQCSKSLKIMRLLELKVSYEILQGSIAIFMFTTCSLANLSEEKD